MKMLIVDDHPILREGFAEILRQAYSHLTVFQARNVDEGLEIAGQNQDLDAIFLDLNFSSSGETSLGGIAAIPLFLKRCGNAPIIILSSSENPADVQRALSQGAMGYVAKSANAQTVLSALKLVLSGNVYLPSFLADRELSARPTHANLTERQIEVLEAICQGLSNKDIGLLLDLSEKTVKVHVSAIFRVLNVVNRTQAVNAARSTKLIAS